jgi:hypothetical protein
VLASGERESSSSRLPPRAQDDLGPVLNGSLSRPNGSSARTARPATVKGMTTKSHASRGFRTDKVLVLAAPLLLLLGVVGCSGGEGSSSAPTTSPASPASVATPTSSAKPERFDFLSDVTPILPPPLTGAPSPYGPRNILAGEAFLSLLQDSGYDVSAINLQVEILPLRGSDESELVLYADLPAGLESLPDATNPDLLRAGLSLPYFVSLNITRVRFVVSVQDAEYEGWTLRLSAPVGGAAGFLALDPNLIEGFITRREQ